LLGPGPAGILRLVLAWGAAAGFVACVVLLVRRLSNGDLRELSPLDDYLANLVIALLLASSVAFHAEVLPGSALRIVTALMLLYLPLGKLRHAVFFFLARGELAARLGLRGVYPTVRDEGHGLGR
jgi:nitrate reductase gamma subunit